MVGEIRLILLAAALQITPCLPLPESVAARHSAAFVAGGVADVWRGRRSRNVCAWRAGLEENNGEAESGSKRLKMKKSFKKASAG